MMPLAMLSMATLRRRGARARVATVAILTCAWPTMVAATEGAVDPTTAGRPLGAIDEPPPVGSASPPFIWGGGLVSCVGDQPRRHGWRGGPGPPGDRRANPTAWPDTRHALATPSCLVLDHDNAVSAEGRPTTAERGQPMATVAGAMAPAADRRAPARDGRSLHERVGKDFTIGHRLARQMHLDWWFWADPDQGATNRGGGLGGAVDSAQASARGLAGQAVAMGEGLLGGGGRGVDEVSALPIAMKLSLRFTWPPGTD